MPAEPYATVFPAGWSTWGIAAGQLSPKGRMGRPFGRWIVAGEQLKGKLP